MRTTLNIDDTILQKAAELTGVAEKTALVRMGLEALIARASRQRLSALGVAFTQPPVAMGPVTTAVFDDTCGNLFRSIRPVFLIPIDRSIPGVAARSPMEQISIYDHEKNGSQLSIGR